MLRCSSCAHCSLQDANCCTTALCVNYSPQEARAPHHCWFAPPAKWPERGRSGIGQNEKGADLLQCSHACSITQVAVLTLRRLPTAVISHCALIVLRCCLQRYCCDRPTSHLSGAGVAGTKNIQAGCWTDAGAESYDRELRCIRKVRRTSHYTHFYEPLSS